MHRRGRLDPPTEGWQTTRSPPEAGEGRLAKQARHGSAPLPAVCGVNCKCIHPSMLTAVHISTDEYIVPTSVDYRKLPHRSPPGSQASTSHPSSPIHSDLVGGGQPVCDLLPVTQSHIRHPSDVQIAAACMYRITESFTGWMTVHRI